MSKYHDELKARMARARNQHDDMTLAEVREWYLGQKTKEGLSWNELTRYEKKFCEDAYEAISVMRFIEKHTNRHSEH